MILCLLFFNYLITFISVILSVPPHTIEIRESMYLDLKKRLFLTSYRRFHWCIAGVILCLSFGCTTEESSVPQPDQPPPSPFRLEGSLDSLQIPSDVISIIGSNLLSELIQSVREDLVSFLSVPLDLRSLWLDDFIRTELLFEPQHVHLERPLRSVQFKTPQGIASVRLVGINDRDQLLGSLGEYLEQKEVDGAQVFVQKRYKNDTNPLHFVFLEDDFVVSSFEPRLLSETYRQFFQELGKVKLRGALHALYFPSRLDPLLGGDEAQTEWVNQLKLHGSTGSVTRQKKGLINGIKLMNQVAGDSDRVDAVLQLEAPRVSLDLDWSFKDQSPTKLAISKISVGGQALLDTLVNPVFVLSLSSSPALLRSFIHAANENLLNLDLSEAVLNPQPDGQKRRPTELPPPLGTSSDIVSDYIQRVREASQSLKGDLLLATLVDRDNPTEHVLKPNEGDDDITRGITLPISTKNSLRWVGLFTHTDRESISQILGELVELYKDRSVRNALKRRGIVTKILRGEVVEGLTEPITHFSAKIPRVPSALSPFRELLKDLYDAHVWIGQDLGIIGFSNAWRRSLHQLQSEIEQREEQSFFKQAQEANLKSPFFFLYFDPIMMLKSLQQGRAGSILLPLQMMFSQVQSREGISMALAQEDNNLKLRFLLPHSLLETIRNGVSGNPQPPSLDASPTERSGDVEGQRGDPLKTQEDGAHAEAEGAVQPVETTPSLASPEELR